MKDFKATNTGNRIVINCATIKDVQALKNVILKELKNNPIGLQLEKNSQDLLQREIDFTGIIDFAKNTLIGIDTSQEFHDALYNCLKYCTYKTTYKIDESLFDNEQVPEAREDYYEIMFACVWENLRPFSKSLLSVLKTHLKLENFNQLLSAM